MLLALGIGQLLSFLIALTGIFSASLVKQGVSLPASQSVLNYLCLAILNCSLLAWKGCKVKVQWYLYFSVAALDVLANFCLVLAYRFTSLTSVTLLDCFTVPCVLLFSKLVLKSKYKVGHWVGAAVCLSGLGLLVATDTGFQDESEDPQPLLGDLLVLGGAALYAISNVAQEKLLGEATSTELLAMLGVFGSIWGSLLAGILEGHQLAKTSWSLQAVLAFAGFNAVLFAFSSLVPMVLILGGAATLNLSLLTSDIWAALARIIFFDGFSAISAIWFLASFLLVAAGLVGFTCSGDSRKTTEATPEPHKLSDAGLACWPEETEITEAQELLPSNSMPNVNAHSPFGRDQRQSKRPVVSAPEQNLDPSS